ncbi:MAG: protecting protein DprA [Bacteroidota bacterium]|nr:protecting protein DprA [Bacteroidota bacterium]
MNNELFYGIALRLMKGVGDANAKMLISYTGSAENLFKLPASKLKKINGVGPKTADLFKDTYEVLLRAEKELKFIQKHKIETIFYYDKRYPKRLLNCGDSPLFIFCKGKFDFNKLRFINIVGTRNATQYGKELTEKLITELAQYDLNLVSGLAFGIDICAHIAALKYDMQNIGVLAHGLDRIYPGSHRSITEKMQENGALVTDFLSETNPDRQNFPSRNRIVAGMTDATIVIESAITGGALITADIANSYNRDVFAFPGRVHDEYSAGCHRLIKQHKAVLVTCANDIIEFMNWDLHNEKEVPKIIQSQLFIELNPQEKKICEILSQKEKISIDELTGQIAIPQSSIANILLQLEMKGVITSLPGKMYKLI